MKTYLQNNPEIAEQVEAQVRQNLLQVSDNGSRSPAQAAQNPIAVSADDFNDED